MMLDICVEDEILCDSKKIFYLNIFYFIEFRKKDEHICLISLRLI